MKNISGTERQFVICIDNSGYPASLELHKIYAVLPDERAAEDDFLRVVDESGEDYLYSAKRFVPVELPQKVKQSWVRRVRESTTKRAHFILISCVYTVRAWIAVP